MKKRGSIKAKEAKCPKCEVKHRWDWCNDNYHIDGFGYATQKEFTMDTDFGEEHPNLIILYICECGEVNSIAHISSNDNLIYNCKEWEDIDWEADTNSYDIFHVGGEAEGKVYDA